MGTEMLKQILFKKISRSGLQQHKDNVALMLFPV